jgi:hypothetical protein
MVRATTETETSRKGGMMDTVRTFTAGVIAIGLVTAFGLHASGLAKVGRVGFSGASGLLGTAEKG